MLRLLQSTGRELGVELQGAGVHILWIPVVQGDDVIPSFDFGQAESDRIIKLGPRESKMMIQRDRMSHTSILHLNLLNIEPM